MRKLILVIALYLVVALPINAQSFSSGSTGADGALDLAVMSCPGGTCEVQLPESGILHYTTINVPSGRRLVFRSNFRNTPAILLAQGPVTILGVIHVIAYNNGLIPAPGGFYGGSPTPPQNGFGPGGGIVSAVNGVDPVRNGRWVGNLSLVPIVGGSGGAGRVYQGLAGGGAIVIASSSSISLGASSEIVADAFTGNGFPGEGSGGAIRLVANAITASGYLLARGGGSSGNNGVIRLEAPAGSLVFNGTATPSPILSTTVNPQIFANSNTPSLAIVSVGGFPVSYTAGRPDSVDLILSNQLSDPINVVVQAHNIPVGTQVNLNISGPSAGTFSPGTLAGTQSNSSTTIGVTGLSRTGATYLIAFADFTLPSEASNLNKKGPDQIAKLRVIAKPGSNSRLVFLRNNGTEIELSKVPGGLQKFLGVN